MSRKMFVSVDNLISWRKQFIDTSRVEWLGKSFDLCLFFDKSKNWDFEKLLNILIEHFSSLEKKNNSEVFLSMTTNFYVLWSFCGFRRLNLLLLQINTNYTEVCWSCSMINCCLFFSCKLNYLISTADILPR